MGWVILPVIPDSTFYNFMVQANLLKIKTVGGFEQKTGLFLTNSHGIAL